MVGSSNASEGSLSSGDSGSAAAITVQGLRKAFIGKEVLSGIDLNIRRGTVFGYIGPNGAGKTTTVKILCGLLDGFQGDVTVAGVDVRMQPDALKHVIGYVPEAGTYYEGLTALEFLQLVGRIRELDEDVIEIRASSMLEAFDLKKRAHSRLGTYSKGMRQKVLIASALLHDPTILFFDEPLSGLDVESTVMVKELVAALARNGKTIFYCSHIMDVVERLCDRIAIISGGRIVAEGTFGELAQTGGTESLEQVFGRVTGQDSPAARIACIIKALGAGRKE